MRATTARLVDTGSDHRAVIVDYDVPAPLPRAEPVKEPAVTRYSRAEIGLRPARGGPGSLDPAKVTGLVFHWPAMKSPLRTVAAVMSALRSWQNYHMDTHGWSDIAYQVAVDQAGNRYDLRGLRTTSGANGGTAQNVANGAVLLILAPNEEPSEAMVAEVRNVVADHRALFPRSTRLLGHSDVRPEPTACPGPAAMRLIRSGAFEPTTQEEDDMALDDKLWPNDDVTVRDVLRSLHKFRLRSDARLKELVGRDGEALAESIGRRLTEVPAERVKAAVKEALREGIE